jgi:hypothetical protein
MSEKININKKNDGKKRSSNNVDSKISDNSNLEFLDTRTFWLNLYQPLPSTETEFLQE